VIEVIDNPTIAELERIVGRQIGETGRLLRNGKFLFGDAMARDVYFNGGLADYY
jgi:hypothetical protein